VRIPLAIESARSALAHATERARSYEQTQLPKLDRLVRSAEAAHGAGERSAFELVDAYRTAREVRLHALDLRREAKRSETDLWRALGRRP
jgi:outer membrane protein TolC